jgi:hypothetical protein
MPNPKDGKRELCELRSCPVLQSRNIKSLAAPCF